MAKDTRGATWRWRRVALSVSMNDSLDSTGTPGPRTKSRGIGESNRIESFADPQNSGHLHVDLYSTLSYKQHTRRYFFPTHNYDDEETALVILTCCTSKRRLDIHFHSCTGTDNMHIRPSSLLKLWPSAGSNGRFLLGDSVSIQHLLSLLPPGCIFIVLVIP